MKRLLTLLLGLGLLSCSNDDSVSPVQEPQVVAEFKQNLSELNLYSGNLKDLEISPYAFPYRLNTPLFTDYAHKERLIALPEGTQMRYNGDGLPIFPDNTVIAKTFYYNLDERNPSLGRKIVETRVLIKTNDVWTTGDYKWNEDQTDAILDLNGSTIPINWIDTNGTARSTDYEIPSNNDCFTCHSTYDNVTPIGPKLRSLNFDINGYNQLQNLIDDQQFFGVNNANEVGSIVNWEDPSASLEDRARSYFDINCAHCHIPGGFCEDQSTLNLDYAVSLEDTNIELRRFSISSRMGSYNPGFSMPYIGTTMLHAEGVSLIQAYLDTL